MVEVSFPVLARLSRDAVDRESHVCFRRDIGDRVLEKRTA